MPACLQVVASQPTSITTDTPDVCTGYVLMTGTEYQSLQPAMDLWTVPDSSVLQQAFMTGLSLVLICYLVSWAFGSVIKMFP
ncbi:hypothetical protein HNQ50_001442 [Silvimonas terrae]|uniref:Uncharacterized protein n=1 Tax=Silvimonas terrae TaxID=300266 RepID=A0A840REB6_9NEIS|nr:hypothetical protein [Silvimonas terrae]